MISLSSAPAHLSFVTLKGYPILFAFVSLRGPLALFYFLATMGLAQYSNIHLLDVPLNGKFNY